MAAKKDETWKDHWKCFVACGIIVLSPFQYGVDFGLIGGLQAMRGFLEVRDEPPMIFENNPPGAFDELKIHEADIISSHRSTATKPPVRLSDGTSIRSDSSSFPLS
jgi:hypothetical protein